MNMEAKHSEEIKNKRDIVMDLSDTETTAKICRALSSETRLEILKCLVAKSMTISELAEAFYLPMSSMCLHIKTLKEANLITVVPKPGMRGSQKLCGIKTANVSLDVFAHVSKITRKDASLLWFTKGYLEYQFSNYSLLQDKPAQIEFSFEACSEAPGYNNNWPSDITFELNHKKVVTFLTKGDYGGRKGIYNPSWWSESNTQFGEYKKIHVTHHGCYMDNQKVSDETIESLGLLDNYFFSFILKVDDDSQHIGGMNLFGKHFGDYAQDIVMKVEYENS